MQRCDTEVYIGLGSNLDSPETQLRHALRKLASLPDSQLKSLSRIYRSAPVGPEGQPDYLNAVALLHTGLQPEELLDHLQEIERQQQRVRNVHWGPRTIDLDILLFGEQQISSDRLTVPHPFMHQRNFVLIPMLDINPKLIFADGISLANLATQVGEQGIDVVAEAEEYLRL